jgi:hypothetical protein
MHVPATGENWQYERTMKKSWSGTVMATGTDGINTCTVPIGLNFLPITQNSGMASAGSAVAGSDYG